MGKGAKPKTKNFAIFQGKNVPKRSKNVIFLLKKTPFVCLKLFLTIEEREIPVFFFYAMNGPETGTGKIKFLKTSNGTETCIDFGSENEPKTFPKE